MSLRIGRHSINLSYGRLLVLALIVACIGDTVNAQAPAAPSNVSLRIVRDNAIDVFWRDNSNNEVAFDVFRRSGGQASSLLGVVDANITSFQDRNSGIRPNLEFCYRVAARNASGSSSSPEMCVTVPPRPKPPSNLQLSRPDLQSPITLTWNDESSNETDFLIYRDSDGTAFVLYDTVDTNGTTYADFVLRTEATYCYFVSAINAAGESPGTDPACLNLAVGVPSPPVTANAESISDAEIRIGWTFGLINYATLFVERSSDGQETWTDVFQTTEIVNQYNDSALSPNTEYCYRIRVENATDVSSFSPVACASTSFAQPDAPQQVEATGIEGGAIEVTWQPVMSAQILYRVEKQSGEAGFDLAADSLSEPVFSDITPDPALVSCYRVRAFNPEFASDWSETACGIVAPDPVSQLQASPHPTNPTSQILLSWDSGTDVAATSFAVSYRIAGEGRFSDPVAITINEAIVSGLENATDYEVLVRARRVIDENEAESSPVTATAKTFLSFWPGDVNGDGTVSVQDIVVLAAPACFGSTTNFSSDGRSVVWAEVAVDVSTQDPAIARCDTDRNGTVDVFDFLGIAANAGRTTGKRTSVTPAAIVDASHRTRLEAFFETFAPAPDNPAQQRLKDELGEILRKAGGDLPDEVSLGSPYPNPARNRISAILELPEPVRVATVVVNSAGQVVRRVQEEARAAGAGTIDIDVSDLAPGLYFVVVESGNRRFSRPITILR